MEISISTNKQLAPNTSSNKPDNDSLAQKKKDVPNNPNYIPTLRKNNKTAYIFGPGYFNSVKEAIFEMPCMPFMPQDIPESLKQLTPELQSVYVCGQCRDCFRFSSTLEEHTARRSWILGYWCQHCFQAKCVHVPKGKPMCSACLSSQFYKRAYLRSRGMKKGQRAAIIRLFYNQCQFFAHLKTHNITSVEINDLMLMPFPPDVKKEDHAKLEKACKSLMEYGFLNRLHIMEFLREKKAQDNWWDPPPPTDPKLDQSEVEYNVAGLINTYRESDSMEKFDNPVKRSNPANKNSPPSNKNSLPSKKNSSAASMNNSAINTNNSTSNTSNSTSNQNISSPGTNNLSVTYYHSPYRPPADIAFVDCGPSHSLSVCKPNQANPQYTPSKPTRESDFLLKNKNVSGLLSNQISQNSRQSSTTSTLTSTASSSSNKVYTMSTSNTTTSTGPKISVKKFASEPASNWGQLGENSEKSSNQPQPTNANTKILTVHSEKCLDLSSIISQLPPDVMNSKKIVFIEQNSNQVQYQKNAQGNKSSIQLSSVPTLSANCIKVVPQRRLTSKEDRNKPIPILPAVSASQVKQVSQPVFKNMMKPSFPINSGPKMKTFAMNTMSKPVLKTVPIEQKLSSSKHNFAHQISTNPSGVKLKQINSYDGKIFYQSGKKYVIKQANKIKSPSAPANSVLKSTCQIPSKIQVATTSIQVPNSVSYTVAKALSKPLSKILPKPTPVIPSSISPLTPSPSPSELSSSSSCDAQAKQVTNSEDEFEKSLSSVRPYKNLGPASLKYDLKNLSLNEQKRLLLKYDSFGRSFLHLSKSLASVKNTPSNVTRYRQDMLDTLPYLTREQIEKRIVHVKKLGEDYSRIMQITDDKEIMEHTRLIGCLKDSIVQAKLLNINTESQKESSETDENSDTLDNWEDEEMQKCPFCEKLKKPNNYLPGFSRLSTNESTYCQCYNCHCTTCNTFQGNMPRFAAHINYHEKNSPHTCPECMSRFSSSDLLEKHVWLNCFHPLVKNWLLNCKVCGIEGLTTFESLTRHFLIMHTERGFLCSDCKRVFFSEKECREHQKTEHQKENNLNKKDEKKEDTAKETNEKQNDQKGVSSDKNSSDPVEIIMCKVGRCIVLKENFKSHLVDHMGVAEQIFYKCPFCPFSTRESEGVKELLRDHMFSNHSHVLPQYINFKTLNAVQETIKNQKSNNEEVLPMIVNTRTIAQEAFEKGTQDEETQEDDKSLPAKKSNSDMPMIIDIRSEADDLNSVVSVTDEIPKILEVKSIADDSLVNESRDSDSRKRKSSTVIEITFSPEKISSMEITNEKVDENLTESETENSAVREKNFIEKEKSDERENPTSKENPTDKKDSTVEENNTGKENPTDKKDSVVEENSTDKEISAVTHDNSRINKEKSVEPAENSTEEEIPLTSVNALENLKAKMCRTFKTLAKKMEASTTTLQQEYSKSLPKLKNISEVVGNISKADFQMEINENVIAEENIKPSENRCPEKNSIPDENLKTDIVEPPPLSRIPQYLLNSQPIVEDEQPTKKSRKRKRINKIAFNGPLNHEEAILYFKCHVCNKMIDSSWPVLKSHFNLWHQDEYKVSVLNPQLLKISSDYIEGGYKEVLAKKYKYDSSPRKRKRRTRFAAKIAEKASMEDKSAGICVTTEPVEEDDGTFKCKKCDLRFSDMGNLREHISKSHRIKGRYLVCLECGENFVVAPSLQMHLKAFHAIDDPLTYLLQNTAFAPENMDDTEEEEEEITTEANQCYVCMAVFEDKAAVDKHLRVHGMAFLNRKRIEAKKGLNSPEKKFKVAVQTGEEKQNGNENFSLEKPQEKIPKVEMTDAPVADSLETEVSVF